MEGGGYGYGAATGDKQQVNKDVMAVDSCFVATHNTLANNNPLLLNANYVHQAGEPSLAAPAENNVAPAAAAADGGLWRNGMMMRRKRYSRSKRASMTTLRLPFSTLDSPPLPPPREIDPIRLKFLFEKELQRSDVGPLRRIVLPKKAAEEYLPALENKEGMSITMDDMDGKHVWRLRFRFWPNNNSRMYILENTGSLVKTHGLKHGDFLAMYQDCVNGNYVIRARKAADVVLYGHEPQGTVGEAAMTNVVPGQQPEVEANAMGTGAYFPEMLFPAAAADETAGMSFIYDTTSFSNDSPLDFLGGAMTDYSRVGGHNTNFGSIDNLSFDDFFF
ncbi:OLC1v1011872C1 [Oldenlandia corymbosa var. corymbosa]|uniref:OLC1v1011872C1 n=1 Tax=Oldenlandia corymbosa var. corymbosa TaxID=529605 RepID=A0AAV1DUS4_OLDCO|nr:OLC1v1011872C1 [Oldenlandia corymbosa var. corymbosa]